jgi:hypothetical protein
MILFEEALRTYALDCDELTFLIEDRWFADILPQGAAVPAVVVQQISEVSEHNQQGHAGLERARYQLTVWAPCSGKAAHVAAVIARRLDGKRGQWGHPSIGYIEIGRSAKVNRTSLGLDRERKLFGLALDFMFVYRSPDA